jgi:hypothetical protein
MFDSLTADELSELQERMFSGWTSSIRLSLLTDGSMFWKGVEPMRHQLESLYREVSDVLGFKLLRQPVKERM